MQWRRLRRLPRRAGPCTLGAPWRRSLLFWQRAPPLVTLRCFLLLLRSLLLLHLLLLPGCLQLQLVMCGNDVVSCRRCSSWRRLVDASVGSLKRRCCMRYGQRLYVPEEQIDKHS